MGLLARLAAVLALLVTSALPTAHAQGVGSLLRSQRWPEAEAATAEHPDPVARKLVLLYRLMSQGGGSSQEIADFLVVNGGWPQRGLLQRRLQEALAAEPDDRIAVAVCRREPPRSSAAQLRCADAASRIGKADEAAAYARQAWVEALTDPAVEQTFLRVWSRVVTPEAQWQRFDRLCWGDGANDAAAQRQAARLDPVQRSIADARLALRRNDPAANALASNLAVVLAGTGRSDPALLLEQVRWLRRANMDVAAGTLLLSSAGLDAEAASGVTRRPAFWAERVLLARRALRAGDAARAYELARTHRQDASEQVTDAEFLAGWVALRKLGRVDDARRHFQAVADASRAAITQGRAQYWLGRALAASGDADGARAAFGRAASWPTTFYGQLGGAALGETGAALRVRLRDPEVPDGLREEMAGNELVRGALLLIAWGERPTAKSFVAKLDEAAGTPASRALAARLAVELGWPDAAVAAARRAGRDGGMLPVVGWPAAFEPPGPLDRAVSLAIMRQESSFDVGATSPAGARGLMQLMPATARQVAQRMGEQPNLPALVTDAQYNMRLGTGYLQGVLARFGDSLPLAFAAYNAGPGRVQEWLAANGDPRLPGEDMIDWIEAIPFNETRNYVQRVVENVAIYRALAGQDLPHPLARAGS